jgi:hypothetical protein
MPLQELRLDFVDGQPRLRFSGVELGYRVPENDPYAAMGRVGAPNARFNFRVTHRSTDAGSNAIVLVVHELVYAERR